MSAGFAWQEMIPFNDPANDNINMFNSGNYLNYAISRSMENTPSTVFNYNSGCPVIIAGIIEKATRMPLEKFAETYLFKPLGITEFFWIKDTTGFCHAGGGLYLKPIDVLKMGILVQQKGTYKNTRIVSEGWIDKMTFPWIATSFDHARYGYYWWFREETTSHGRSTQVLSAEGAGGQKLYLFREYDLIIAFTERNYTTPQVSPLVIREGILPCLE
jgi:CubicO group peptidase (beta-lactamase class C family)